MITVIGSLIGFGASVFPKVLDFFQDKADKKQELALHKMQIEAQNNQTDNNLREIEAVGDAEYEKAYLSMIEQSNKNAHKDKKSTGIKWIDALRGSVRPITTYLFMSLYIGSKVVLAIALLNNKTVSMLDFSAILFSETDMAIFSTILVFWFGDRVMNKRK